MSSPGRRDHGFTLVEMIVVVAVVGLLSSAIAFAFVAIVRTSPSAEARADDARTTLGLNTYLPEDVNSTPSTGFDFSKSATTGCSSGGSPGVSLVRLAWTEAKTSTKAYTVSYRYTGDANGYNIFRYECTDGGPATVAKLTNALPPINEATWNPGDAPVVVTPSVVGGETVGLTFEVTTIEGEVFFVEARSNNPADTLPPINTAPPTTAPPVNTAPSVTDRTADVVAGSTVDVDLTGTDFENDPLTYAVPPSSITAGWTVVVNGATATVTPPGGAVPPASGTFQFTATDTGPLTSNTATVTVTVIAAPINNPPTAGPVVQTIAERTPVVIPLPVNDLDLDPLTVTLLGVPPGVTATVLGTNLTVAADGSTATPAVFQYSVSDGQDTATADVILTVTLCQVTAISPTAPSVAKFTNGPNANTLKSDVTFTLTTTGNCADILTMEYDNDLTNGYQGVTRPFNNTTKQVTFNRQAEPWTPTGPFTMTVLKRGISTGLTATMTVTT